MSLDGKLPPIIGEKNKAVSYSDLRSVGWGIKNIVIAMVVTALASIATVMISKSIGVGEEASIGRSIDRGSRIRNTRR